MAFSSMLLPNVRSMTPSSAENASHTGRVNRCECSGGERYRKRMRAMTRASQSNWKLGRACRMCGSILCPSSRKRSKRLRASASPSVLVCHPKPSAWPADGLGQMALFDLQSFVLWPILRPQEEEAVDRAPQGRHIGRSVQGTKSVSRLFPGVDPSLQEPSIWPDVHTRLMKHLRFGPSA